MSTPQSKIPLGMADRVFGNVPGWSGQSKFKYSDKMPARKADLELALTILLVDLAGSDEKFDPSEYQIIVDGLHRMFGTNALQVKALVNQAILVLKDLRGTNRYGSLLKDHLKPQQHVAIMEIVDEVIAADGVQDGFEIYIRRKISDVLGIEVPEAKVEKE